MSKRIRHRFFVDNNVQGRLLSLLVRCWALSLLIAGGLTVAGWIFITPGVNGFIGPNSMMGSILPMMLVGIVSSLLALPVMMWKLVRDSNRFAGPLVRFRRYLREAAESGQLVNIHFRDGDDWQDLAEAYNDLVARINSERLADHMSPDIRQELSQAQSLAATDTASYDAEQVDDESLMVSI